MKTVLALAGMVLFVLALRGEEPVTPLRRNSTSRHLEFSLPDSLRRQTQWTPTRYAASATPVRRTSSAKSSLVPAAKSAEMPTFPRLHRVEVYDDNTLHIGTHLVLSNGQAWNWGGTPANELDARTLSFPLSK